MRAISCIKYKGNHPINLKRLHLSCIKNTKNDPQMALDFKEFSLPFGGKLNSNNRWIKLRSCSMG